jgi:hypothetical protein
MGLRHPRSAGPASRALSPTSNGRKLTNMNPFKKPLARMRSLPNEDDWAAAKAEAKRLQDRNLDVRVSQRSPGGENYQSGRGTP